jgi:hypothetical protein
MVITLCGAFLLSSCSSGPNLSQDQATVKQLQARVSSDHLAAVDAEHRYGALLGTQPTPCTAQQQLSPDSCVQSAPLSVIVHAHSLLTHAASRLQKDRDNLKLAQGQLKKDESGG